MKRIYTYLLLGLLSLSNLGIFGMVFHTYINGVRGSGLRLASTSEEDIAAKIERSCGAALEALRSGASSRRVCLISINRRHEKASYKLSAKFHLRRQGDQIIISSEEKLKNASWHAVEADFCNHCGPKKYNAAADQSALGSLIDIAQAFKDNADRSVERAYMKYNQSQARHRLNTDREKQCEGKASKDGEAFYEFETIEKLQCKINKLSRLKLPQEIEELYHSKLKKDLWTAVIADELGEDRIALEYLLEDFNPKILSVQLSKNLLRDFLSWKDDFDILPPSDQAPFLKNRGIERDMRSLKRHLSQDQFETDFAFLNQALKGALDRIKGLGPNLNPEAAPANTGPPPSPEPDYEAVFRRK